MDELPPYEVSKIKKYPMVWHNKVTGKPAFMVHSIIAWKLHIKTSPDDEERIVNDVDEVRRFLNLLTGAWSSPRMCWLRVTRREISLCGTIE